MCVQVPIIKPPKLSDVLFDRRRRDAEKTGIRNINVQDEIDDLDQPLFPDSGILIGQSDTELDNSKFFEIQNETDTEDGWTTPVYEKEIVSQPVSNQNESYQVNGPSLFIVNLFRVDDLKISRKKLSDYGNNLWIINIYECFLILLDTPSVF